jgi:hypothetical protein
VHRLNLQHRLKVLKVHHRLQHKLKEQHRPKEQHGSPHDAPGVTELQDLSPKLQKEVKQSTSQMLATLPLHQAVLQQTSSKTILTSWPSSKVMEMEMLLKLLKLWLIYSS